MNNKISIIIPVYNVSSYLDECLLSVTRQSYKNIEIICVDDGSNDGSGEKCDSWAKNDSRITVIHQKNAGVSNARNRALEIASGTLIGFVDADDIVEPNHFEFLQKAIERNNADLASSFYKLWSENSEIKINIPSKQGLLERNEALFQMLLPYGYRSYLFTKLFKKEIIENDHKIRFNENLKMMEDLYFVVQYMQKSQSVFFFNNSFYKYRVRNDSAIHTLPKIETLTAFEKISPLIKDFDIHVKNMFHWTYYTTIIDYLWNKTEIPYEKQHDLLKKILEERRYFYFNHKYSKKGFLKKIVQEQFIRLRFFFKNMVSNV